MGVISINLEELLLNFMPCAKLYVSFHYDSQRKRYGEKQRNVQKDWLMRVEEERIVRLGKVGMFKHIHK